MEEMVAAYPSIHPPCEVQFVCRVGSSHDDGDGDDRLSSGDDHSPLSSPPNSPYQNVASPLSEARVSADLLGRAAGAGAGAGPANGAPQPSREPAPFDEEGPSSASRAGFDPSELAIPAYGGAGTGPSEDRRRASLSLRARRLQEQFAAARTKGPSLAAAPSASKPSVLPFEDEQPGTTTCGPRDDESPEGPDDEPLCYEPDLVDLVMAPTDEGGGFADLPERQAAEALEDEEEEEEEEDVSSLDGSGKPYEPQPPSSPSTTQDATITENDDAFLGGGEEEEPPPHLWTASGSRSMRQQQQHHHHHRHQREVSQCQQVAGEPHSHHHRVATSHPPPVPPPEPLRIASSRRTPPCLVGEGQPEAPAAQDDDPSLNLQMMSESTYEDEDVGVVVAHRTEDIRPVIDLVQQVVGPSLSVRPENPAARWQPPPALVTPLSRAEDEEPADASASVPTTPSWDPTAVDRFAPRANQPGAVETASDAGGERGRKGWWMEEEIAKRERRRTSGRAALNAAERIVALSDRIASTSPPRRSVESLGSKPRSAPSSPTGRRPSASVPGDADEKASSPEMLSIVGLVPPPAVNRVRLEVVTTTRECLDIKPATPIETEKTKDGFHSDADTESTGSMIESLDAMVRDLHVGPNPSSPTSRRSARRSPEALRSETEPVRDSAHLSSHALASLMNSDADDSLYEAAKPVLVKPLDSELGIPKGDVMLSLLNKGSDWASNVQEAVWRCRTMRRNCDTQWLKEKAHRRQGLPSKGRTSIPVDVDDCRVSGGLQSLVATQTAAVEHLKYDDFDDALSLYEDILQSYDAFFESEFGQSSNKSPSHRRQDVSNYKLFVGMALHNVGIIKLLKGEYSDALTYFERATLNRASSPGSGHPDHVSSLVKMALCHFALEDFVAAQAELEESLVHLRVRKSAMADCRLYAEVLNNLGCLSYMYGRTDIAVVYLEESLDQQSQISDQALYAGSRFSCHNGTLNATITKVNLGLISLATGDATMSIAAFEAALRDQQLLLRDAHVTLLATIEYLVIANLVSGKKDRAIQLLRRMLHMQVDAYGPDDPRCVATGEKIAGLLLELEEATSPKNATASTGKSSSPEIAIDVHAASGKFRPFAMLRKRQYKAM